MNAQPVWITYLSALLTPVVAIVGATIAYRQWRTAQNKLKLDLFEKRFAVYEAVYALVKESCLDDLTSARHAELVRKAMSAMFLFDSVIAEYVVHVGKASLLVMAARRNQLDNPQDTESHSDWLMSQLTEVPTIFSRFLQLSH
jgi:ABC-type multidrug transport system fused ATPase/permease subunit